jgi:glycerol-3-phosphate dehydrogenase
VAADETEIDYLIAVVNRYFKPQLARSDIVHAFSGVRPLYDDNADNPSAVTRDYVFELDAPSGGAPVLSVFGGKITTFRKLAEHAMEKLAPFFPAMGPAWTATGALPGGDMPGADFEQFLADLRAAHRWMPADLAKHYARLYGTRTAAVVGGATSLAGLGRRFGPCFYEAEAVYLRAQEWAVTADDVLERRTKHHLHMTAEEKSAFRAWWSGRMAEAV